MSDDVTREMIRQLADLRERLARLEGSEYVARAGALYAKGHPWYDVMAYGAKGDGATDDTVAIQAAIDAAYGAGLAGAMSSVFLPRGNYIVSDTLVIKKMVRLIGSGFGTQIKAAATFPVDTALIQLGLIADNPTGTWCTIEQLTVHCNDISGSTGIFSAAVEELGGVRDVIVRGYKTYGIHMNGTRAPANFSLEHIQVYPSGGASDSIGIYIQNTGDRVSIYDCTVVAPTTQAVAIMVEHTPISIHDVHIENHVDGIRFGAFGSGTVINVVGNGTVTNLINLDSNNNGEVQILGAVKNVGTNTIVCSRTGETITDDIVGFWAISGGGTAPYNRICSLKSVMQSLLGGVTTSLLNVGSATGASTGSIKASGGLNLGTATGAATGEGKASAGFSAPKHTANGAGSSNTLNTNLSLHALVESVAASGSANDEAQITLTFVNSGSATRNYAYANLIVRVGYYDEASFSRLAAIYQVELAQYDDGSASTEYYFNVTELCAAATSGGWTKPGTAGFHWASSSATSLVFHIQNAGSGAVDVDVQVFQGLNISSVAATAV